jgi:dTDP-4-dehydrorhamnose reductase
MTPNVVAVVGSSGQVARALKRVADERGVRAHIRGRPEADLGVSATLERYLDETNPGVVVNAAAYTAVDQAEREPELAFALNARAPGELARLCAERGLPLIHLSSDYVFDGSKTSPYLENDPVAPVSVYGASKAAGDDAVRAALKKHVILRTAWVYGLEGRNFVKTMMRLAKEREELGVVSDQLGCPTFADDIASAVLDIAAQITPAVDETDNRWGTFHLTNAGATSWHDFARQIFTHMAEAGMKTPRLKPIGTEEYPTPARRPAYSVLDCTKIGRVYGVHPAPWTDALSRAMPYLLSGS